jgi:Fe-S-cluster-containing dehydrogenase component/formate-dependent nitrite reductase membrane component NrfD
MRELPVYNNRQSAAPSVGNRQWSKVIDHTRCIGCHACTTACKSENEVPLSVTRTYVKYVDVGVFPQARRSYQVTRCNQCASAPCVVACPTTAMFKREDGIVDFDKSICIGCKACIAACPYDAIFINPEDNSAEKCNFCAHRIDVGLEPACVVVCPTQAILVGDMNDTNSYVSELINRSPVAVRRPEKETHPKLFYKGAHQTTLDPLAARRPDGGLFMWSEQLQSVDKVVSGHPVNNNSSAAALLSYDVAHSIPWGWRVSLYTWTKGIAAGAYLVPLLLVLFEFIAANNWLWLWVAPIVSGAFLGLTGLLLTWDLKHPERFYLIFTKHQWKSWLVKGAFIITAYSLVLAAHFVASLLGSFSIQGWLMIAGLPLSVMTAIYTAFLFAQAKARDLWQSPLLPPHLFVQALLLGSAVILFFAAWHDRVLWHSFLTSPLLYLLGATSLIHVLMVWGELTLTHTTAHAKLATWEMTRGRFKTFFVLGIILSMIGCLAPYIGVVAIIPAFIGMLLYEHAYVQSGQSVPLA